MRERLGGLPNYYYRECSVIQVFGYYAEWFGNSPSRLWYDLSPHHSLLTLDYSERSAWTVLIRAARAAGTNDAKIAEATMTAADPINGSSPGSWSAGT
jgi:hypothetical protein